jgi:decaprenylphospho-beta-D-ribofuranose 2-oxidase
MKLSGWGRTPVHDTRLVQPDDEAGLRTALAQGPLIARGNGRAYGDSAVGRQTVDMRRFDRVLAFDSATGQLVAEAGILLGDIIAAFLPQGWFPAVTPGTKFVTLGGMIAADVHGKNHHRDGGMRATVDWIDVMDGAGGVQRCTPSDNHDLFDRTVGGMGLTGIILRAAIRLRPVETGWIRQTTTPAANLAAAMDLLDAESEATYSVAWIDCLATGEEMGRSLVMTGEHAQRDELGRHPVLPRARGKKAVPFDLPGLALNRYSVRAFNALYWQAGLRKQGTQLVDWDSYFYPLDAILGWNRIYGRKGFLQFQCVLPDATARAGMTALLQAISASGQGSFLAVLKRLGAEGTGISFPQPGHTLALDFPATNRAQALFDRLEAITLDHGGRFYLAKDARLSARILRATDGRIAPFAAARQAEGEAGHFASMQSDRLQL